MSAFRREGNLTLQNLSKGVIGLDIRFKGDIACQGVSHARSCWFGGGTSAVALDGPKWTARDGGKVGMAVE